MFSEVAKRMKLQLKFDLDREFTIIDKVMDKQSSESSGDTTTNNNNNNVVTLESLQALMRERTALEEELQVHMDYLTKGGGSLFGLHGSYLDSEGYPSPHLDIIIEVKKARSRIACIQNDYKSLMKKIENDMASFHSSNKNNKSTTTTSTTSSSTSNSSSTSKPTTPTPTTNIASTTTLPSSDASNSTDNVNSASNVVDNRVVAPFVYIDLVSPGSPAERSGLLKNDQIYQFGSIGPFLIELPSASTQYLQSMATIVRSSENTAIPLSYIRDGKKFTTTLTPRKWTGQGLIGLLLSLVNLTRKNNTITITELIGVSNVNIKVDAFRPWGRYSTSIYVGIQAVIIMFDLCNETSFNNVKRWSKEVEILHSGRIAEKQINELMVTKSQYIHLNIKIIGDRGVGKLNYLQTCLGCPDFKPSSSDRVYQTDLPHIAELVGVSNLNIKVDVYQPGRYSRQSYRGFHAIVIIFDLCDRISFDNVKRWYNEVERYCAEDIKVILVGNKLDLAAEHVARSVTEQEINELMYLVPFMYYYETHRSNPEQRELFDMLATEIMYHRIQESIETQSEWIETLLNRKQRALSKYEAIQRKSNNQTEISTNNTTTNTSVNTNMDTNLFRMVFRAQLLRKQIWNDVRSIHRYLGLRCASYFNVGFMCLFGYFNVLSDRYHTLGGDGMSMAMKLPGFVNLIRFCPYEDVIKHFISSIPQSKMARETMTLIADQCYINGNINVIKWLLKNYNAFCSTFGMTVAIITGNLQLLSFILEHTVRTTKQCKKKNKENEKKMEKNKKKNKIDDNNNNKTDCNGSSSNSNNNNQSTGSDSFV
ncbi:26S proteasome non-ATPase regulatory subunit 9 [Heterostelium album PN500]|uniref:26S proteasome non-ATPase regulatory subunit 9 n=1 Tax=Heterostelium pallidum (strain ATCC 26659 / Pp 5 / PN500) TaxID=670386 RepID=D3B441_HETP5|nr:26S proteasome non-ATPase regulatory subunit 9 [Heterostelium album PN500]EFA84089.1 26S proteasome non-ATPase regulatory subunit 9 [Heterostelium album PN500]|eukprot:XP_020436206.1 26S proteasome non-ATPase regulatory subunit 9 [Heterostelium album PN500]